MTSGPWTPGDQPPSADSLVEEADFTIAVYNTVKRLGCHTFGHLARLSRRDVVYQVRYPGNDPAWAVAQIDGALALVGLGPLDPVRPPRQPLTVLDAPEWTFGALCVLCDADQPQRRPERRAARVREAVIAAYATDGAEPMDLTTYLASSTEDDDQMRDPPVNIAPMLGSDLVVIQPRQGAWVWVQSERWELAPQGRHPLALRLSARWPVLSVTSTRGVAYEVCHYEQGAPVRYAAHGRPTGPTPVGAPLDFSLLAAHSWMSAGEAELRAVFGHPLVFAGLAGLANGGFRSVVEGSPLDDMGEWLLVLRGADG